MFYFLCWIMQMKYAQTENWTMIKRLNVYFGCFLSTGLNTRNNKNWYENKNNDFS